MTMKSAGKRTPARQIVGTKPNQSRKKGANKQESKTVTDETDRYSICLRLTSARYLTVYTYIDNIDIGTVPVITFIHGSLIKSKNYLL